MGYAKTIFQYSTSDSLLRSMAFSASREGEIEKLGKSQTFSSVNQWPCSINCSFTLNNYEAYFRSNNFVLGRSGSPSAVAIYFKEKCALLHIRAESTGQMTQFSNTIGLNIQASRQSS